MKQPESPPKGKVLVLCNSFFEKWEPDIVPETFDNAEVAEQWIKAKLEEEPGDLYVICTVEAFYWASVKINKRTRKR